MIYATFAIICFMEAVSSRTPIVAHQSKVVAQANQDYAICSQRLYLNDENPRRDLFLTVWSTRNCSACQRMEAEIPALQDAGYNVVLRKAPAPRFVKAFPTTVVNRGNLNGERVTVITGFKNTSEIDTILQIGEVEEDEEEINDEDYNIFQPWAQVNSLNLVVWLRKNCEICDKQYDEIAKLRKLGFSANVYMVHGPKTPPPHIMNFPTVILIDNRKGIVVSIWPKFVTADEIQAALK